MTQSMPPRDAKWEPIAIVAAAPGRAQRSTADSAPGHSDRALAGRRARAVRTLRAKAIAMFVVVVAYILGVGTYLQLERSQLLGSVRELEELHAHDELLARVNAAASNVTLSVNEAHFGRDRAVNWQEIAIGVEGFAAGLHALSRFGDEFATEASALQPMIAGLFTDRSRDVLFEIREVLNRAVHKLDAATIGLRERKQILSSHYRGGFDELTLKAAAFTLLGLSVFGAIAVFFFARMAWDIRRMQRRSTRIVNGYRGAPLAVTRHDEVGDLMEAINDMQAQLRAREARLDLSRQEKVHKEKMAAIGALAAGIAHEINNPIAAIAGVAEEIAMTREERSCPLHGAGCQPELILEHARRVASITQQIANFSSPGSPEPNLVDLNSLVESTCAFVGYDRRYRSVELVTELDRALPAVRGVADHLTQILMNLLVNAADACESVGSGTARVVCVRTAVEGDRILLEVRDNGVGMSAEVVDQAFDEYFTTKLPGHGTGLGLALCKQLAEGMAGAIKLESAPGAGTRATLRLPVPATLTH